MLLGAIAVRPNFTIRFGTPVDAECLSALGSQVWLHTYAKEGIRPTIARYIHEHLSPLDFRHQLERLDAFTVIAEVNAHLVGFAAAEVGKTCNNLSPASSHLDKLYVQEHFLRMGIGCALLKAVQTEAARRSQSSALWLTVNSKNKRAQAFYAKQGFTEIGIKHFDLYGEQHENRILHALDR